MCIIVVKEAGIEMPDRETLERCFAKNRDGAGFMFADGKQVRIRKGFMTFDDFEDALYDELAGFDMKETAIIMHFRIATHGKVKPEICHPFPVSSDPDDLRATSIDARFGIAHNGIISGRTTNENWSDTMDFVADVVAPLAKALPNFIHNDYALEVLEGACLAKLAIINGAGEIKTVGQFYENEGVKYSNTGYVKSVYNYSTYGRLWDDDYYYKAYPSMAKYGWYDDDELDDGLDDDMDALIAKLPYEACGTCLWNEECVLTMPCCESEDMAWDAKDTLDEEYAEELGIIETVSE